MKRVFAIFRMLSLDVVLGAWATGGMAATYVQVDMPWVWWIALPLSVWVIYTTDHLLDAYRLQGQASTPRHRFHAQYFKPLLVIWVLAMGSCLTWIPYWAPRELLWFGLGMGGMVLLHLGLVAWVGNRTSWLFVKELGVGSIYTLGIWGSVWAVHPAAFTGATWCMVGQFGAMALINLLFFSRYELHIDEQDGHSSFVRAIGPQRTGALIMVLAVWVGVGGMMGNFRVPNEGFMVIQTIFLLMLTLLLWVAFDKARFGLKERYRVWGDAVFLLPGLAWMLLSLPG